MAWTSPRTWVASEVVTAALFNAHIRDNFSTLKTPFTDLGKIQALSSTYLANLSGANLTGLVLLASDNDYTAGTHDFTSASAFVVPVGTDKWAGTGDPGSIWVEGDYLHHIDEGGDEWRMLGDLVSSPGASYAGCVWLETSTNRIHYVDADGDERTYTRNTSADATGKKAGSLWVEGDYLHQINSSGSEFQLHNDVTHDDHNDHTDTTSHSDHTDHSDYTDHDDAGGGHTDGEQPHTDHTDYVHVDIPYEHYDYTDHTDHDDHTDAGSGHSDSNPHSDYTDHGDTAADSRPELVP